MEVSADLMQALGPLFDKLNLWYDTLVGMLPNILLAVVIFFIGTAIARRLRNVAEKSVSRVIRHNPTLSNFLVTLTHILLLTVVCFIALRILNLDGAITTALAGAGIVGLALAFAFQDIAANFMSGIFLTFQRPFALGDAVKIKEFEGYIQGIELRNTTMRTYQGHIVTIPNKDVLQNTLTNFTRLGKCRADVTGGVCKDNDLRHVQRGTGGIGASAGRNQGRHDIFL